MRERLSHGNHHIIQIIGNTWIQTTFLINAHEETDVAIGHCIISKGKINSASSVCHSQTREKNFDPWLKIFHIINSKHESIMVVSWVDINRTISTTQGQHTAFGL